MNQMKLIFVIGAPRSGTHMLASHINKNVDNVVYLGEINEIWKEFILLQKSDWISSKYVSSAVRKKVYQGFLNLAHQKANSSLECEGTMIMKKTPANTIRFPFVAKLFPDARFIHIIRDGRDVAISYRKKARGDANEITKTGNPTN